MYMQCKAKLFSNPVKSCEECKVSSAADLFQTFHDWPPKRRSLLRFQRMAFLSDSLILALHIIKTKIMKAIITMLLIITLYQLAFPGYVW